MNHKAQTKPLNILLADDDRDDRFFFDKALKSLPILTQLETIEDGEKLMAYLFKYSEKLPDVLFLDLNMPRKNGSECLKEIKSDPKLKQLPVIIYSTSLNESIADVFYKNGAHYYVRKTDLEELKKILLRFLTLMAEKNLERPSRDKFVITLMEV